MLATIPPETNNAQSPFDSIKHISESGREYWSARELMQILGYSRWNEFKPVIENAKENIEIGGANQYENFLAVELKSSGRTGLDYHLSRLAAYHVALSCDSRGKDAVKLAKHYFVTKTRAAELVIPAAIEEIEILKLRVELASVEREKSIAEQKLLDTRHYIATALPEPVQQKVLGYSTIKLVEYRDRIISAGELINEGDTINKTELCRRYGILTRNGKPDYKKLNDTLSQVKLPGDALKLVPVIRDNAEIKRDYLPQLDKLFLDKASRQLYIGESKSSEWDDDDASDGDF